jgi:hypothetical protein
MPETKHPLLDRQQAIADEEAVRLAELGLLIEPNADQRYLYEHMPTPATTSLRNLFSDYKDKMLDDPISRRQILGILDILDIQVDNDLKVERVDDIGLACCPYAEKYLAKLRQPSWPLPQASKKVTVYLDHQDQPIALRKQRTVSSGLLLKDAFLRGLPVPKGTLISFSTQSKGPVIGMRSRCGTQFSVVGYSQEFAIRPLRLTPWAFDDNPFYKDLFACNATPTRTSVDRKRLAQIRRNNLFRFTRLAEKIVDFCI